MKEQKRHSSLVELFIRLAKEKPLGTLGGVIVLALLVVGVFAGLLAPYGMNEIILADRLDPPSANHILGVDQLGRDLLSRIIFGARISMIVGLSGAALSALVSTIIGAMSGFIGGRFDMVVQRFVDAFMCFPPLFLYLTVMATLGPGLWQVIMVLGVLRGVHGSRVVRSAVMGVKQNVYVDATVAIGCTTPRIIVQHILPNIMAVVVVLFTIAMGHMIILEATLSFLGYGIPPPTPSWGGMLSFEGRRYMLIAPHMAVWPGLVLAIAVYGINMFGDALRDLLDPRLRGGLGSYGRMKGGSKMKTE